MKSRYTKLKDGSFGARVFDGTPQVGDTIAITTKAGKVHEKTVAAVVWSGAGKDYDDDIEKPCVLVRLEGQESGQRETAAACTHTTKACVTCGVPCTACEQGIPF